MMKSGLTRIGTARKNNEDRFLIKEYDSKGLLLGVADGMGGHAGGDRAAETACENLQAFDAHSERVEEQLPELVKKANHRILAAAANDVSLHGMGTTLTAAFINDHVAYWVHAGDSRLYLFRDYTLVQISDDHSYPGMLLKNGELSAEQARLHPMKNLLLNCLGGPDLEIDAGRLTLEDGDLLLLSTDGLHDWTPQEAIAAILEKREPLQEKLTLLLQAALAGGSKDDITIVAAQL